jgi:hypothetical protein
MPYIITTYGCRSVYGTPNVVVVKDRRAVATLDEAREAARRIARELPPVLSPSPDDIMAFIQALPVVGGWVGPLPDGTAIEVAPVPLARLFNEMRHAMTLPNDAATEAEILDAYNESAPAQS